MDNARQIKDKFKKAIKATNDLTEGFRRLANARENISIPTVEKVYKSPDNQEVTK